jgi:hypothetical protein
VTEIERLREQSTRLDACCQAVPQMMELAEAVGCDGDAAHRMEELVRVLASGKPGLLVELIEQIASDIKNAELGADHLRAMLYWATVDRWLASPEVEQIVARIDHLLKARAADSDDWDLTAEAEQAREAIASAIAPIAGVDVSAAGEYAALYVANFPPFSLPLGDVDRRAAAWLAQIFDLGSTRRRLREVMARLASTWAGRYPRAGRQVGNWAALPMPADPTQDGLWVGGLVPLARAHA